MNYRYQIQGRYFLVALFFLNIVALLPVVFVIQDTTPHENAVFAGMLGFLTLNTVGMGWCLWTVMPKPLPTYNRFQNFLYRRRAVSKPWLHRALIVIFAINLGFGIAMRFSHRHHSHLTGQVNASNWILISSAAIVLLMYIWPLPPVKAESR